MKIDHLRIPSVFQTFLKTTFFTFFVFFATEFARADLASAMDQPTFTFTTSGDAVWTDQATTTHDGVDAAKSGTIADSQNSTMQVTVAGPATVKFWWKVTAEDGYDKLYFYVDGVRITGITGNTTWAQYSGYDITSGNHTLAWKYETDSEIQTSPDSCGWVDQLTVLPLAPAITTQPVGYSGVVGGNYTFTVNATNSPTYQWKKDGVAISGATNATYTISSLALSDAGNYTVVVATGGGSVTSNAAVLTVNASAVAPSIITQPISQTLPATANVTFSVSANGTSPLTYQWKKNGTNLTNGGNITGVTTASLTISNLTAANAGNYTVAVTNPVTTVTSDIATLAVLTVYTDPIQNPYFSTCKWKLWWADPTPMTWVNSSNVTVTLAPSPMTSRLSPWEPESPLFMDFRLGGDAGANAYMGNWADVYMNHDGNHKHPSGEWFGNDGNEVTGLNSSMIQMNDGELSGWQTDMLQYGVNFTSQSTTGMGHTQTNYAGAALETERDWYFSDILRCGNGYISYTPATIRHYGMGTEDLFEAMSPYQYISIGASGSSDEAVTKLTIVGSYLKTALKQKLMQNGAYPATLLYLWKACLPYDAPYISELRHRVEYVSNGLPDDMNNYTDDVNTFTYFPNYDDNAHMKAMIEMAKNMTVAPPIAILSNITVSAGGATVYSNLKTSCLVEQKDGQSVVINFSVNSSYDLQGLPLTYTVQKLYPNTDATIVNNGGGNYTVTVPWNASLPSGRTQVMVVANNGSYDSNPAIINVFRPGTSDPGLDSSVVPATLNPSRTGAYPVAFSITGMSDQTILPGETVSFSLNSTVPSQPLILNRYSGEVGTLDANAKTFTWTAPANTPAGRYPVTIIGTNGITARQIDTNSRRAWITVTPTIAVATADVTSGAAPLAVKFSSAGSRVLSGSMSYLWDFDDGTSSTAANPSHTYVKPGIYRAKLTVTGSGGSHSQTVVIHAQASGWTTAINPGWSLTGGLDGAKWTKMSAQTPMSFGINSYGLTYLDLLTGGSLSVASGPGLGVESVPDFTPPLYVEMEYKRVRGSIGDPEASTPPAGLQVLGAEIDLVEAPTDELEPQFNINAARRLSATDNNWKTTNIFPYKTNSGGGSTTPDDYSLIKVFVDHDPNHAGRYRYSGTYRNEFGTHYFTLDDMSAPFDSKVRILNGDFSGSQQKFHVFRCVVKTPTVTGQPVITSSPITGVVVNTAYSYTVAASATPNATYSLTTAPAGMTINATTGVINWTPSSTGVSDVTVQASNGTNPAATQSFTVTVAATSAGALGFSAPTYSNPEGNSGNTTASIAVSRSGGSTGSVSVSYATSNGNATSSSDYLATSGTLTWADGDSADKLINVTLLGDTTVESDETVNLTLSSPSGGASLGQSAATLTIVNDEGAGVLSFSKTFYYLANNSGTAEGANGTVSTTISVTRSGGSTGAVSVNYTTADDTATVAGSDYVATSGTLNWANGDTATKTFTVLINGDATSETTEALLLQLNSPTGGATIGTSQATLTILTDESQFAFSSPTYTKVEGNSATSTATITVNRYGSTSGAASVNYATSNGGATSGSDYTATSGTLSFAAGDTSKTFTVTIAGDATAESDETINLTLSSPSAGTSITQGNATLTIVNDDAGGTGAGTIAFASGTLTVSEGVSVATVTVQRTGGSVGSVGVSYKAALSAYDAVAATPWEDFIPTTGTLTWANGDTADKTFTVTILDDSLPENAERLYMTLVAPTGGAILGTATKYLNITDDDTQIAFKSAFFSVAEGNSGTTTANITVSRLGSSTGAVGVTYATGDGTATAGSDYVATSGTLSWANGDAADKTFTVTINGDTASEADETILLGLRSPTGGASLGQSSAVLTITTDETAFGIVNQPASTSTPSGQTATLRVAATGVGLSYQWYQGSAPSTATPISGATAYIFTTPALTTSTSYWVQVKNSANATANSTTATVSIGTAQTITFGALSEKQVGDADFSPGATASSGLAVSYASSNPAVATVVGGMLHIVGVGDTTITASQTGNATYAPATPVSQILSVVYPPPVLGVTRSATTISHGGTDAIATSYWNTANVFTYTLANSGGQNLSITNPVVLSSLVNCTATVSATPASTVLTSGNTTLGITVTPTGVGPWSVGVAITNTDTTKNPFTWTISGNSIIAPPRTVDIDFGATATAGNWTSTNATTGTISNLIDSSGTGTGVNLTIGSGFSLSAGGMVSAGLFPTTVTQDGYYVAANSTLTLAGLDNSKSYTIICFGSYTGAAGVRKTNYTINGTTQSLETSNNINNAVTFVGVSPSAGQIPVTVGLFSGATNAMINAMEVIIRGGQVITFDSLSPKTDIDVDFSPGATISSNQSITYTSSNNSVATLVGGNIHIVGAGNTTITASQAGDAYYEAAASVSQNLTVTVAPPTIVVNTQPTPITVMEPYSGNFTVAATLFKSASSIAYQWQDDRTGSFSNISGATSATYNTGNASVSMSGRQYRCVMTSAGAATVTSDAVALTVTPPLTLQTISFPMLTPKTNGAADFAPGATASSGLAVSYTSSNTSVATIVAGQIHIVGLGTTTITASQAGNGVYAAATNVAWPLTVVTPPRTVNIDFGATATTSPGTWNNIASASAGTTSNLNDSTGVGTGMSVTLSAGFTASANGYAATNGQFPVTACQDNFYFTTPVSVTLGGLDNARSYTITGVSASNSAQGIRDTQFSITGFSPITLVSLNNTSSLATFTGAIPSSGNITLSLLENNSSTNTGVINALEIIIRGTQGISFPAIPTKVLGDADFAPGATSTANLTVTYASSNSSVATIVGGQIHIVGAGTSTITASVNATNSYEAAPNVTQTLTVTSVSPQTITFGAISDVGFTTTPFTLNATSTSGLPVTFSVVSGNASVSGTSLTLTGTGVVTVRASQAGNASYSAATPVDRSFTVTANYDSWLAGFAWNGGNSTAGADPDGDGMANLIEYALGSSPVDAVDAALPEVGINGQNRLTFTFFCDAALTSLTYEVEASNDLVTWTPIARSTAGATTVDVGGGTASIVDTGVGERSVIVTDATVANTRRFLRLRVSNQ